MDQKVLIVLVFIETMVIIANFSMPSLNPVIRIILGIIGVIGGIMLIIFGVAELNKRRR